MRTKTGLWFMALTVSTLALGCLEDAGIARGPSETAPNKESAGSAGTAGIGKQETANNPPDQQGGSAGGAGDSGAKGGAGGSFAGQGNTLPGGGAGMPDGGGAGTPSGGGAGMPNGGGAGMPDGGSGGTLSGGGAGMSNGGSAGTLSGGGAGMPNGGSGGALSGGGAGVANGGSGGALSGGGAGMPNGGGAGTLSGGGAGMPNGGGAGVANGGSGGQAGQGDGGKGGNAVCLSGVGQTPTEIVNATSPLASFALDATSVYWVDNGESVLRVPKAGGTVSVLASGSLGTHSPQIALDSAHIYWSGPTLFRVPLAGGTPEEMLSGATLDCSTSIDCAGSLSLSPTHAFRAPRGRIQKVSLTAPFAETTIATLEDQAGGIDSAIDATDLYWVSGYDLNDWSIPSHVRRVALDGSSRSTIATLPKGVLAIKIVVDATRVYWLQDDGSLWSALKPGGAPELLASGFSLISSGLGQDQDNLYFAKSEPNGQETGDQGCMSVVRLPKSGGIPVILASPQYYPVDIQVDEKAVYWISNTRIMTVAK